MEAIKDGVDFSNPTGRTNDHVRAKPTITNRMPQFRDGCSGHFLPTGSLLARFHKSQRPRDPAQDEF